MNKRKALFYDPEFISHADREEILRWIATLYPLWEQRFSTLRPLPEGEEQRWLLRPVYWLGNWQFACLDYYHPPHGILNRCVKAEPFPPVLQNLVRQIEGIARSMYRGPDLPGRWHLNTCLVNFYGSKIGNDGKRTDTARVGEHKDFEPGPVASLSLGERALFQFVSSRARGSRDEVIFQQWLDDRSLQIFGGSKFKRELFHRVQRVDRRGGFQFPLNVENFETRRINFTFRYVPEAHVIRYCDLPPEAQQDVHDYMKTLSLHSRFFHDELIAKSPLSMSP